MSSAGVRRWKVFFFRSARGCSLENEKGVGREGERERHRDRDREGGGGGWQRDVERLRDGEMERKSQ